MKERALRLVWGLVGLLTACDKPQFSQLTARQTGITFANRITETDSLNILDYEYVYNGGGVGVADFNGDGRQDVYFSGNQVANRLYLNRGNFKFEDVTEKSGATGAGKWCSGVALVDINADGRMDIYVGATTYRDSTRRENLLYVNQGTGPDGIPTFRELAREYGIADNGYTTNAAFFDYDNDGDLDLYVLTDAITGYPGGYREKIRDGSSISTGRLYRNDFDAQLGHARFTNVTRQAGLTIEGYGLGVNVCDINRDGFKDIYVTNDFITNDLLWMNNGNGTFTDRAAEYFKHLSNSAMGNDVTDLNNDGLADVVVLDMMPGLNGRKKTLVGPNSYQTYQNSALYGYTFEYPRNTLQLNLGSRPQSPQTPEGGLKTTGNEKDPSGGLGASPVFAEIGLLAGVAQTDWSWCPLVADFDHDGYRDLIVTNGFPKDVTDRDFIMFRGQSSSVASKQMMLGQIPEVKLTNYAFRNRGAAAWRNTPADGRESIFEDVSRDWGITQPSFSNGAAYADFDGDGDLDYVVNNINDSAFVFRNNEVERGAKRHVLRVNFRGEGQNSQGLGAIVELHYRDANGTPQTQFYEHSPYRGYLSTQEATAHFGLGDVAVVGEVVVTWPGGRMQTLRNVKADQVLTVDIRKAGSGEQGAGDNKAVASSAPRPLFTDVTDSLGVRYVHREDDYIDFNVQKLLPHKLSQFGPSVAAGDANGDGLDDLFLGGPRRQRGTWLWQQSDGKFRQEPFTADPDGEAKQSEDAGTLLFDADGDGDLDLYVVSGGNEQRPGAPSYQDRLYVNDGRGHFTRDTLALPGLRKSGSCVKAADFDRDGDLDLFIGGRVVPDRYPEPASCFLLRNDSRRGVPKFTDVTAQLAPGLRNIGLVCDALWTDYDRDGYVDLLLAGEWMPLTFFKNERGRLNPQSAIRIPQSTGWWNSLAAADFDRDGDVDYLVGNLGLNTLNRASPDEPIRIYAKDFNKDGSYDAIPTVYFPDESGRRREVTFHGRDDLIKQMISMRAKFPLYKDFAAASLETLLSPDDRKDALVLQATYLTSAYLENQGGGKFVVRPLPLAAQMAPVFGMVTDDFNADGNPDALLVGNDFGTEVLTGRYDALNGLLLLGDGKGGFRPQSLQQSGFYVPGDAKGLARLGGADGRCLVAATQNRGPLKLFRPTDLPGKPLRLQSTDAVVELLYADGKRRREEPAYGNTFYGQSARVLWVDPAVKSVEVTDFAGRKRKIF
jgi:hypothetical protein